jgi:hypothetical protein
MYEGDVLPHPDFKIVLKVIEGQEKIISANADLAVIQLHGVPSASVRDLS